MTKISKKKTTIYPIDQTTLINMPIQSTTSKSDESFEETRQSSSDLIETNKLHKRILLNTRGQKFDILLSDLSRFPNTRLGKLKILIEKKSLSVENLLELCDDYDFKSNEFYFNRNPSVLSYILSYFNDGSLHYEKNICSKLFSKELEYWGFNEYEFDECCQMRYFIEKDEIDDEKKDKEDILYEVCRKENFGNIFPNAREYLWNIIDKPIDSKIQKV